MVNNDRQEQELLALARQLVQQLEAMDGDGAQQTLDALVRIREVELFRELGGLTRDLHDTLKSFQADSRLCDIVNDIPDARERLSYVIALTEQAAHRTLTAIESGLPLANELGCRAGVLAEQWRRFQCRELGVEEFRHLSQEVETFFGHAQQHSSQLQTCLGDALLAQDYQDLTGQIIRRVIVLVQEVEDGLVKLIRISGQRLTGRVELSTERGSDRRGHGPVIPGQGDEAVRGQDEVDDLLSSLGF